MKRRALALLLCVPGLGQAYPLDAYGETGIRRLEAARLAQEGKLDDRILPTGARLSLDRVRPSGVSGLPLPPADTELSAQLKSIAEASFGKGAGALGLALLDLSDPEQVVYAAYRDDYVANAGSVGKLVVLLAALQALADRFPDDTGAREQLLRSTMITADDYIIRDQHKVPLYSPQSGAFTRRQLKVGDVGSFWEYLDWMASPSSNGAASMVIQQLVLMGHLGERYPLAAAEARQVLDAMGRGQRGTLMRQQLDAPLLRAGFDTRKLRQASALTYQAKQYLPGERSMANPRDLVRLLAMIEGNQFIDEWSSREAKRLLYLTDRRTRYASTPTLNEAAVYFKSGSLYSCQPEPGFECGKYQGNRVNLLASLILVEWPAADPQLRYIVALMSNVLRRNSAVSHQGVGRRIHKLLQERHQQRAREAAAGAPESTP